MPPILKQIGVLQNINASLIDILKAFVFAGIDVKEHNPNTNYMKGDLIIKINSSTLKYEVLQCKNDNIIGEFNTINWGIADVNHNLSINNIAVLSNEQPTDENNQIWFQPLV